METKVAIDVLNERLDKLKRYDDGLEQEIEHMKKHLVDIQDNKDKIGKEMREIELAIDKLNG